MFLLLDLAYYGNLLALRSIPKVELLIPNVVFGGYALIEVGRYVLTRGETRESRYITDRQSLITKGKPTSREVTTTTATGRWFGVLILGLLGEISWGLLQFTPLSGTWGARALHYGSLLTLVIAVHYDMEYVAARAGWGGHRRWEIGFLIFPLNLVIAAAYIWMRRQRLRTTDESNGDSSGTARPPSPVSKSNGKRSSEGPPWSGVGWHYLIPACLLVWLLTLTSSTVAVGSNNVVNIVVITVWVLLPVATYLDIRKIESDLWKPRRAYWVLGTLVPFFNLVIGGAYLFRRYETIRAMQR